MRALGRRLPGHDDARLLSLFDEVSDHWLGCSAPGQRHPLADAPSPEAERPSPAEVVRQLGTVLIDHPEAVVSIESFLRTWQRI
jgi:hypothetical protein